MKISPTIFRPCLIFLLTFAVYSNTLTLDYALDDRLVIFENNYTLQGWKGVKPLFVSDSFSGYFTESENLVSGGRYRPLAQLTFIIEYELFGGNLKNQVGLNQDPKNEALFVQSPLPFISHLNNVLLYAILCLLVYYVLLQMFTKYDDSKWYLSLPFMAAFVFAIHPIHTEAVANIKGRDEILCMLGAFSSLLFSIKYLKTSKWYLLILSLFCMIIALFSKENAITFLAIIPLALYFMPQKKSLKTYFLTLLPIILASIFFLSCRTHALGSFMVEDHTANILNNPFINSTLSQKLATIIFTFGIYLRLLFFPWQLTHDYYPKQIAIVDFTNPIVLVLLLLIIVLIIYVIKTFKQKKNATFAILFFVITFSITSNVLFPIGTFMNERFLFIPFFGFALLLVQMIHFLLKKWRINWLTPYLFISIFLFYSGRTFARNFVWENDITLFTTDVNVSKNSIKCNISAGGSYLKLYQSEKKEKYLRKSQNCLDKALSLDPTAANALMLMGELYFYKEDYDNSYRYYNQLHKLYPENELAAKNIQLVLQQKNNSFVKRINALIDKKQIEEAWAEVNAIVAEQPENADALNLKGKMFGQNFNHLDSARYYFMKALKVNPNHASAWENLGVCYALENQNAMALEAFQKSYALNADNKTLLFNMSALYKSMGNQQKSEEYRELATQQP